MSIILNENLSCFKQLKSKFPSQVVERPPDGKVMKAFSSMRIGVINLMPTKEVTERQWSTLMASSIHWVEPVWIQMSSYQPKNISSNYLNEHYMSAQTIDLSTLGGIILTGAPIEHLAFESVDYWEELSELLDRITEANIPILSVCWGAQALLYKRYGVEKHALKEKCFGVFEHQVLGEHPLTKKINERVYLPHSRHTAWETKALENIEQLEILIHSNEVGVFALEDCEGDVYWSGHPEYESDTLLLEYQRDLEKGINIEMPKGYERNKKGDYAIGNPWGDVANQLLGNWLSEIK
jgi:homoserine O-succinyltransferase